MRLHYSKVKLHVKRYIFFLGINSPEDVSVEYHSVSWFSTNETNTTTKRTVHQPYINFKCMFVLLQDESVFYKIEWYVNNATLIKTVTVSEADIGQATLSSHDLPPLNQTAGLQVSKHIIDKNNILQYQIMKKQHKYISKCL